MTVALTPAVADPLSGTDEYPDVAFLARNDVPFDAQTAASMAAQLGAPMFITNPNALADAARDGIADLDPDVIIVAGGTFAVSDAVAAEAAEACDPDCTIDRRFGAGRDQTAADLATIAADYGFDRPVLQGANQVVGDVNIGGTLSVDDLIIQDTDTVPGLNADRLDGKHASGFSTADHQHVALFGSAVAASRTDTSSTSYVDVAGMSTSVTIPSGHTGIIVARFNTESACESPGPAGECEVRILANGTTLPPSAATVWFDSTDGSNLKPRSIQRISGEFSPGTYTIVVQAKVSDPNLAFVMRNRSLTADVKLAS